MLNNLILNPIFLFSILWIFLPAISSILVGFGFFEFYALSDLFYVYLFMFILAWLFGGFFAYMIFAAGTYKLVLLNFFSINLKKSIFLVFFCVILSLFFRILEITVTTGYLSLSPSNIGYFRLLVTELGVPLQYNFINVLNPILFALPAFIFYVFRSDVRYSRAISFLLFLLFVFFVYLSSARSAAFVSLLVVFFVMLYNRVNIIYILFFPFLLVLLFGLIGYVVGKPGFDQFLIYLLAPMHAFDVLINNEILNYDLLSFRPFHGLLYGMGLIEQKLHLLDYIETPYPVNVYTVFGVYFNDFGFFGLLLALFIFSFITCVFHIYAKQTKSLRLEVLSAFYLSYIILGVFYDYYTSSMFSIIAPVVLFLILPKNKFRVGGD